MLESIQIRDSAILLLFILFKSEILSFIFHIHYLPIYTQLCFINVSDYSDYFRDGTNPLMLSVVSDEDPRASPLQLSEQLDSCLVKWGKCLSLFHKGSYLETEGQGAEFFSLDGTIHIEAML